MNQNRSWCGRKNHPARDGINTHVFVVETFAYGKHLMAIGPRPLAPLLFFGLVPVASWFIIRPLLDPLPAIPALYSCFGLSTLAFIATLYLVPTLGPIFIKANLKGRDLLKSYKNDIEMLVWFLFQEFEADFGL